MFIRKTTQKNSKSGVSYSTYRLVRTYRNVLGKVKPETLLNLGTQFAIAEKHWRLLTDRIEQLLSGAQLLFELELPMSVEQEAQRIVRVLGKRKAVEIKAVPISACEATEAEQDYQTVDINSLRNSDIKNIGTEHVAHHAVKQLHLPQILTNAGFSQKQTDITIASVISRLIVPGSELRAHRYLTKESALDEVMNTEFSTLDIKQLYSASDLLLSHKTTIEEQLYQREKELFNLEEVITLFDITNTYFEGHNNHSGAKKGRSKEKRSDCDLISLGLLLDGSGFPKKSKILPGNISEPSTLKDMLATLNANTSTTIIMDAGIATLDNIAYIAKEGYKYIVVKRDSDLVMPENDHVIVKDTAHNKVTVSMITKDTDNTVSLYCHSTAKELKSIEFINKMATRFEEELTKLANNLPACDLYADFSQYDSTQSTAVIFSDGQVFTNKPSELITLLIKTEDTNLVPEFTLDDELTKLLQNDIKAFNLCISWREQIKIKAELQTKLRKLFATRVQHTKTSATRGHDKVAMRIGKLKQVYRSVAHLYDIQIIPDRTKTYTKKITYTKSSPLTEQKQAGIYCLTSNRKDLSSDQLWHTYTMLTDIESAFRSLKSELGMRPIYHQLEHRIDGHIFISIIAYHLLHTVRYQLKQQGIHNSWETIRQILSTQIRVTTTLNLKEGGMVKVRKTSRATPEQALIYKALGIDTTACKMTKSYFGNGKHL